ncbi:MAG: LysR family transcriptional regulator [Lachnospiraceae bacterium]|nr:LysR family transcriptional regulator [Lachnospiraceae bacterium]
MNLNVLRYVIAVAEEKNFSKAAHKLFVSQPSLSQSIQKLENSLGSPLFLRDQTPVTLTYAGELYVEWARQILKSEEDISRKIAEVSANKHFRIRIGVSPHRSVLLMPLVLKQFQTLHPNASIVLVERATTELLPLLEAGKIDLLIDEKNQDSLQYTSVPLASEKILLMIPDHLKIPYNDAMPYPVIAPIDLEDQPFILLEEHQLLGRFARNMCTQAGFRPNIVIECNNVETAYSLSDAGLGISFIPELFVKSMRQMTSGSCSFYERKDTPITRNLSAIYHNDRYIPSQLLDCIDLLKQAMESIIKTQD